MIEQYIHRRLKEKKILLMTHIVIGYPSLEDSHKIVASMVHAGVDIMELQIPFSEPIADGPVILKANQNVLLHKISVNDCITFAAEVASKFPIPFLFMSYYNILFKYGVEKFTEQMAQNNMKGAIVPDLPPEESENYLAAMKERSLAPIFIFTPNTPDERMEYISTLADGFIYCVARKGVTGFHTDFSTALSNYLARCRRATNMPLALGFGVKEKSDIDFLRGKVEIAIIGTKVLELINQRGINSIGQFIQTLK
jgi:tryptophan synthase alpha chain